MEFEVPFGYRRIWEYFKVNFVIMIKRLTEYKVNFWGVFVEQFLYLVVYGFMLFTLFTHFGDVFDWELSDYILFLLFIDFLRCSGGIFVWRQRLSYYLLEGDMNLYLVKPNSIFLKYYMSNLAFPAFFYTVSDIIMITFVLFYFGIWISHVFLFVFCVVLVSFVMLMLYVVIDSFALLIKGLDGIMIDTYYGVGAITQDYPSQFFKGFPYRKLLFVFPFFFTGSLIIPLLRGYEILDFWYQIAFLLGFIGVFSVLVFVNWYFGLKKYEAFG